MALSKVDGTAPWMTQACYALALGTNFDVKAATEVLVSHLGTPVEHISLPQTHTSKGAANTRLPLVDMKDNHS